MIRRFRAWLAERRRKKNERAWDAGFSYAVYALESEYRTAEQLEYEADCPWEYHTPFDDGILAAMANERQINPYRKLRKLRDATPKQIAAKDGMPRDDTARHRRRHNDR